MLSALIAAVISAVAVILSVYFGHWLSQRSEQDRWEREISRRRRDFASTLVLEVEGILARLKTALRPDYREFPCVIGENYFVVFDSNTTVLPLLDESDAQNVLTFYLAAKKQFDALRELHSLYLQWKSSGSEISHAQVQELHKKIQQDQQEVLRTASDALKSLKKY